MALSIQTNASNQVAQKTVKEIRTFLEELRHGTSRYRTVHSLTEQMTHDYANRFLVELIQNGHDAISAHLDSTNGRLKIVLDETDHEKPVLYFANTGAPFTHSNFQALASLGQSDKDPTKSVGNKGLGFRSVLQICNCPQIYSEAWRQGGGYAEGYCFEFAPHCRDLCTQILHTMLIEQRIPDLSQVFGLDDTLIDWTERQFEEFLNVITKQANGAKLEIIDYLSREINHLSPYSLPLPLTPEPSDLIIRKLGEEGYVTVIRMELTEHEALMNVRRAIEQIDLNALLFLNRLSELYIQHLGEDLDQDLSSRFVRNTKVLKSRGEVNLSHVAVSDGITRKEWYVWSHTINGESNPAYKKQFIEACKELPEKWQGFDYATIEIGVPVGDYEDEDGLVYIFLPTEQDTDFRFHINAPFFGEINRKKINVSKKLNELFIKEIASMIVDAVEELKTARLPHHEDAIVDLLSFKSQMNDIGSTIVQAVFQELKRRDMKFVDWGILPVVKDGQTTFGSINDVCLLPEEWNYEVFSADLLVNALGIPLVSGVSKYQNNAIMELTQYYNGVYKTNLEISPSINTRASWAEQVALHFESTSADISLWKLFYKELMDIIPEEKTEILLSKKVLLGQDNRVHSSGISVDQPRVFLTPVQLSEQQMRDPTVPDELQDAVVFFNQNIDLYEQSGNTRRRSSLLSYLRHGTQPLVENYSLDSLLDVVVSVMDSLAKKKDNDDSLFAILQWAITLYNPDDEPRSLKSKFNRVKVPCRGGWTNASWAYFSTTWDECDSIRNGKLLSTYFDDPTGGQYKFGIQRQLIDVTTVLEKVSNRSKNEIAQFFRFCGVTDYLRLHQISLDEKLYGSNYRFQFDIEVNSAHVSEKQYLQYKRFVEQTQAPFSGPSWYKISNFLIIPGFSRFEHLSKEGKAACAKLISLSIPRWSNWEYCSVRKTEGNTSEYKIPSLVWATLKMCQWVPVGKDGGSGGFTTPEKCWFVSSSALRTAYYSYSFLSCVSSDLSEVIERNHALPQLNRLGLSDIDFTNTNAGVRLLEDLATSLHDGIVSEELLPHFKNRYRETWKKTLELYSNDMLIAPPRKLVVSRRGQLEVVDVQEGISQTKVYIPDDKHLMSHLNNNSKIITLCMWDATKTSSQILRELYPDFVESLSSLSKAIRVNESIWNEDKSELHSEPLLIEGDRYWLLPFIMTVLVYREHSGISVAHIKFSEYSSLLKRLKLLQCDSLETILYDGHGEELYGDPVHFAVSLRTDMVFMNSQFEGSLEDIASALREYLNLQDIEIPLKYAFSKLSIRSLIETPDREEIARALEGLKVSPEEYQSVEQALNEALDWLVQRLQPAVDVLKKENSSSIQSLWRRMSRLSNLDDLKNFLSTHLKDSIDTHTILKLARTSVDDSQMGHNIFTAYGVSLQDWNHSLNKLGRPTVINHELNDEWNGVKQHIKQAITALLRFHVSLLGADAIEMYVGSRQYFKEWMVPSDWCSKYWTVDWQMCMQLVAGWLHHQVGCDIEICNDISVCQDETEIKTVVRRFIGEDIVSPDFIMQSNHDLILTVATDLYQLYYVHQALNGVTSSVTLSPDVQEWAVRFVVGSSTPTELLEVFRFEESEVLRAILQQKPFQNWFGQSGADLEHLRSYDDLLKVMNVTREQLANSSKLIEQERERQNRLKRTVSINGVEFDTEESNLKNLWGTIKSSGLLERIIDSGGVENLTALRPVRPTKTRAVPGGRSNTPRRRGKYKEDTIGLTGEIVVYRILEHRFNSTFEMDCWKSRNSLYCFPEHDGTDDSLGYDFELRIGRNTYQIEVKATEGRTLQFEMGSSEIEHAMRVSKSKSIHYRIAFVADVFNSPTVYWLPNPYSSEGQKFFRVTEASSRVSFNVDLKTGGELG